MPQDLPLFTSPLFYLAVFFAAGVAFHILFRRWRPLGTVGWLWTEYFWILVVLTGLVGTSIKVRGEIANGFVRGRAEAAVGSSYRHLRGAIGSLGGGAVCRAIEPAEQAAGVDVQREHDEACRFGRELLAGIPLRAPEELDERPFENRPRLTRPMLLDYYRTLDEALAEFREARLHLKQVRADQEYTRFDVAVLVVSPILAAVGAALHVVRTSAQVAVAKTRRPAGDDDAARASG